MTLADGIEEIYKQYGYFAEKPSLLPFQVWTGLLKSRKLWINSVAMLLNNLTTQTLLRQKTSWNKQLLLLTALKKLTTPPSNVLKYILADDSWFAVRPSGTEPKSNSTSPQLVNLKQMLKKNCEYRSRNQCFCRLKHEAGTKVLASQLFLIVEQDAVVEWFYYADFISFTAPLNCAEVGRRNRILTITDFCPTLFLS